MDLTVSNLSVGYDGKTVVEDLSFRVPSGSLLSLLGPSGSGKTTVLNALAGFLKPASGDIRFGERMIQDLPPEKRNVGMVFQNYALYPHMTAFDNIAFPLKIQRRSRRDIERAVKEIAGLTRIGDLLDRKPSQLSGGQQQRVAISRALVKGPDLLLMDEPLSNLDAALRVQMRQEIRRIQQEAGITALFVTHDQEEALSLSDRIVLLDAGRLQQEGTPKELYMAPRNLFTARFFSNPPANVLETSSAELGLLWKPRALPARAATAVIRPHMLELCPDAPLSGTVVSAEILGRECLVRVRCLSSTLTALTSSASVPAVGTTQGVVLKNEPYFFDSSGARAGEDRR
ncbi:MULTISPECIES: ABC transporter ATP-binding protein [Jonquetella]|uniref:ATPase component of ABC-type sugar transporter n=1 Tax=Jonquetella anthropi DSM 22815 TaxID=885272 RepID=H0UKT7_9BACT|nr:MULTISPECIES: ABC transporter ATP-binding protein [Jonquetella]EHM13296.1 ATPase component of ABC-type sugar transporter [Jonquetella anthropi DSM 22815]ERL23647.1 ABC transporter, ATP-binding protein [Jonquetella sp. BV3C21]